MIVVLHNIRSVHNVGSIFRTADAVGISKIYLCGITPEPIDRFGKLRPQFSKVALGAEKNIKWEKCNQAWRIIEKLKKEGYKIFVVEQDKKSTPYYCAKADEKTVLALGNEVDGLQRSVLDRVDRILEIPMMGTKESLNVSVAFGIAVYSLQYRDKK